MKLSEVVAFLNRLDHVTTNARVGDAFDQYRHDLQTLIGPSALVGDKQKKTLSSALHQIEQAHVGLGPALMNISDRLQEELAALQQHAETASLDLYRQEQDIFRRDRINFEPKFVSEVSRRKPVFSDEEQQLVLDRVKSLSDWKYPGLLFRPILAEMFLQHLVPFDPLYLLDVDRRLVEPAIQLFPAQYQRRLRIYAVDDFEDNDFMRFVPDNQFAFCLSYYYYNFKPEFFVKRNIDSVVHKLRPGGIFAFTLNDCDYTHNAALFESTYAHFQSGRNIVQHTESKGLELVFEHHSIGEFHYFEFRKPGNLTSIRGGQMLSQIHRRQTDLF